MPHPQTQRGAGVWGWGGRVGLGGGWERGRLQCGFTVKSRGLFITFEGMDGSGKTTQMHRLAARLRGAGRTVLETTEPGGPPIAQQIRRILLDAANQELSPTSEVLLYFASRAQNVDEWILPALGRGEIVLADRFTDSSLVYQGCGRGLGAETVMTLDRIACRGLKPELTVLVDVDPEFGVDARVPAMWPMPMAKPAWTTSRWSSIARCGRRTTRWPRPSPNG